LDGFKEFFFSKDGNMILKSRIWLCFAFYGHFVVRSVNECEEYSLLSQADLLLVPEDVRGGLLEIWLRRLARELN
jgi:hypothetical protein